MVEVQLYHAIIHLSKTFIVNIFVLGLLSFCQERIHRAASNSITMIKAPLYFDNGIHNFKCNHIETPHAILPRSQAITQSSSSSPVHLKLPRIASQQKRSGKIFAMRRRRANTPTDTYVLMEPGENEEFVSEQELRDKLQKWLENWPGKSLPPDLARFENIDDAVSFLVTSVCELEIDGDVGSIQWYQVHLE